MTVNPYFPSRCDSQPLSLEVEVRSRFPLEIIAQRTISLNISGGLLDLRVQRLVQASGYWITSRSQCKWTLQRGSLWYAIYTFDVLKLPTTVVLEMISATQLSIYLRCHSVLTFSTPGDEKRISQELDELEAQLVTAQK